MRAIRYLTALGFIASLAAASPAAAFTTVKIVDSSGAWLNHQFVTTYGLMAVVGGDGWGCGGASNDGATFIGGGAGASCNSTGSGVVYSSGGEWFIDYP